MAKMFFTDSLNFLICPITEIRGLHQNFQYAKFGDFGQFYALGQFFFFFRLFYRKIRISEFWEFRIYKKPKFGSKYKI